MNIDKYISHLSECKPLLQKDVKLLCDKAKQILILQPNMKQVRAPVTVCGDIHGQFYDLMQLFEIGGEMPHTNYLFMGDYVDRGFNGVETFSYVLCLKVKHKDRITLLRGNHENTEINKLYGFHEECQKKYYNDNVWRMFTEVFEYLPLAATIESQIFCLHGGLSPSLQQLNQVQLINRKQQIPHSGIMCDMLWSDPEADDLDEKKQKKTGFQPSPRGAGYIWRQDITDKFNHINNLKLICRAHQLMMDGYSYVHEKKCLTIFSAPNYCYRCGNQASVVEVDDQLEFHMHQYEPAPREMEPQAVKRVPAYFL